MIARRLEAELSKTRIFELYLNLIEWGDGIWGAEAASRAYFNRAAADLSNEQAALLAGAIINPRIYSPAFPPARLLRRQRIILARLRGAPQPTSPTRAPLPADDLKIDAPTPDVADQTPSPPAPVEVQERVDPPAGQ
jgi:monofunctional biosynthetic peptidoglycan transglycosylase